MKTTAPLPRQVVVYGAGGMGLRVIQALRDHGVEPLAVLDRHAGTGDTKAGLPVRTATEWLAMPNACRAVVVGIHNPAHPVGEVVKELQALGYGPVLTPVHLCNEWPDAFPGSFWLASPSAYEAQGAGIEALEKLVEDDASRDLIADVLRVRREGDYAVAPLPSPRQYAPVDLPPWPQRLRLIDCGAYTGDTLQALVQYGYDIESAICLEPDPANYRRLTDTVRDMGVDVLSLPCAIAQETGTLRFSAEGAGSSHLSGEGTQVVQALTLDDAMPNFAPNLVKMDIEGAEPDALAGGVRMLQRHRPGLAISIYHHPHHLWQIPLWLRDRLDNYRFWIRAHSHNTFDLVLYGRPEEWN